MSPAPIMEPCGDVGGHGPHFWYRPADRPLEGDAARWCIGSGILAGGAVYVGEPGDCEPIPYDLTERARAELEGWAQ